MLLVDGCHCLLLLVVGVMVVDIVVVDVVVVDVVVVGCCSCCGC